MNIEELRQYCIDKKGVTGSFPFNETVLVFKILSKIFLLTDIEESELAMVVKSKPEKVEERREQYLAVTHTSHLSKKYWNRVLLDDTIDDEIIKSWIDESYDLVVAKLTRKERETLL